MPEKCQRFLQCFVDVHRALDGLIHRDEILQRADQMLNSGARLVRSAENLLEHVEVFVDPELFIQLFERRQCLADIEILPNVGKSLFPFLLSVI